MLADITGVVIQDHGNYYIWPTTALEVISSKFPTTPPPTKLVSNGKCDKLTFGSYNVENLDPSDTSFSSIATHIVEYLKIPSILFLQEIQDNNGEIKDGGTYLYIAIYTIS
jgi:hypothetical protein